MDAFVKKVDSLKMALPWQEGAKITPLPEEGKPGYLKELIEDALAKGAKVINPRGNQFGTCLRHRAASAEPHLQIALSLRLPFCSPRTRRCGADFLWNSSLNVLRVFNEEQFGPLIPVATFENLDEVLDYLAASDYGQQGS